LSSLVIRNATLSNGDVKDIKIDGETIVGIGTQLEGDRVIDASGLIALCGFVDLHTHLREPGLEAAETVLTGSRAAAMGGYTAVHAMANTNPVADTAAVVEQVYRLGKAAGYVDVFPIGAVTVGLSGERLAELGTMARSEAKVRVFSDDGKCVSDPLLMKRAMEYVKQFDGVIAQHAQDPALTVGAQMNEGQVSSELGLTGWPGVAEEAIIARDVLLAESLDSRLHICHLSTARSVDIVRWAKQRGIKVTAEVTPHHLLLTDDLARTYDPVYKVNPPLRTATDVSALREALADGTIDIIATDHAPHPSESKDCEWDSAAFGMIGLETAVSVAQLALIESGASNWQRVEEVMSMAPARIARDSNHGMGILVGSAANLALIDPKAERRITNPTMSKSSNNPYAGLTLPGRVVHTFLRGKQTVNDGRIMEAS
jgi:dihydroorotase